MVKESLYTCTRIAGDLDIAFKVWQDSWDGKDYQMTRYDAVAKCFPNISDEYERLLTFGLYCGEFHELMQAFNK